MLNKFKNNLILIIVKAMEKKERKLTFKFVSYEEFMPKLNTCT